MNHYLVVVDFLGNKIALEVLAMNEKHAKKKVISQSLKFEKIAICEPGAIDRLNKIKEEQLTEKTNKDEIHTTS